jgi:release factor glutamine methyltransferase
VSETLAAALRRITGQLGDAGVEAPALEARQILAFVTGLDPAGFITRETTPLGRDVAARLDRIITGRVARRPLAHLTGEMAFHGIQVRSDARALVPRSDSECVVDAALERLDPDQTACIADLGTGTGCLLLAILSARPHAVGTGIDISAQAIELARENARLNTLCERADFAICDWRDWQGWSAADLIIANPPYIARDMIATLAPEVREHEPRIALDGGADGLCALRDIMTLMAERGRAGAWLVLEIGYDQRVGVSRRLAGEGFDDITCLADLSGNDRIVCARRPHC